MDGLVGFVVEIECVGVVLGDLVSVVGYGVE